MLTQKDGREMAQTTWKPCLLVEECDRSVNPKTLIIIQDAYKTIDSS
jgi:hypothetical protein